MTAVQTCALPIFMVQEFIKESSGTDIRAFVVGNRVVAAMERTAPDGEFRSNVHRGGRIEKVALTNEEMNIVTEASNILGLSVAGVDLMRSDRGPLILEVNSSPGLQGIESSSNGNVADESISFIEQKKDTKLSQTAQVHLLVCHDYDKTRKILLSTGVSENILAYIGLEALETKQHTADQLVKQHRFMER